MLIQKMHGCFIFPTFTVIIGHCAGVLSGTSSVCSECARSSSLDGQELRMLFLAILMAIALSYVFANPYTAMHVECLVVTRVSAHFLFFRENRLLTYFWRHRVTV
jgi:hypothetical protein